MKTALCLYGQPRNFNGNWGFIVNNIIRPNNADVFFHTWYNPEDTRMMKMTPGHENRTLDPGLDNTLPSVTGAVDYKIEKQITFSDKLVTLTDENMEACYPWAKSYDRNAFVKDRVKSHYSMWYSINQSLLLKELYAQRNNFEYDCVIISRFDISPKIIVNVNGFNLDNFISGYGPCLRGEINDWFMICNNINSNLVSSIFYTIDYYRNNIIKQNGIWTNESYLRDQIKKFDINVEIKDLKITF